MHGIHNVDNSAARLNRPTEQTSTSARILLPLVYLYISMSCKYVRLSNHIGAKKMRYKTILTTHNCKLIFGKRSLSVCIQTGYTALDRLLILSSALIKTCTTVVQYGSSNKVVLARRCCRYKAVKISWRQ